MPEVPPVMKMVLLVRFIFSPANEVARGWMLRPLGCLYSLVGCSELGALRLIEERWGGDLAKHFGKGPRSGKRSRLQGLGPGKLGRSSAAPVHKRAGPQASNYRDLQLGGVAASCLAKALA